MLVGGFNHLEKYEYYPIYYGKKKMFQTTNQLMLLPGEPELQGVVQRDLGHQGGHGL
jgi:hypothetical protein